MLRGLLKGDEAQGWLGMAAEIDHRIGGNAGRNVWLRQKFKGLTVYDAGAFQGLLTLFFARKYRQASGYRTRGKVGSRHGFERGERLEPFRESGSETDGA